jgi:hypothetical protein
MALVIDVSTVGPVYPPAGMSGQLPQAGVVFPAQIHRALYVVLKPSDVRSLIHDGTRSQSVVPGELENPDGQTDVDFPVS